MPSLRSVGFAVVVVAAEAFQPRGFITAFHAPLASSTRSSSSAATSSSTLSSSSAVAAAFEGSGTAEQPSRPAAAPIVFSPEVTAALVVELAELGKLKLHHKVLRKYKKLRKSGSYPDLAGYEAVLSAIQAQKVGASADKVILDMVASPPAGGLTVAHAKQALAACAAGSRPHEALAVLAAMDAAGLSADLACFSYAMQACVFAPNKMPIEELARQVMRKVKAAKAKVVLDGHYYGLLLQVLVRARKYKEAVACFEVLSLDNEFKPADEHYLAAMKAATALKDQELVKSLIGEVLVNEAGLGGQYGAIMELAAKHCATANNWRLAVKLLDKCPAPRSYEAYHAVLASCARAGNTDLALKVFGALKADGHAPNRASYNALLHATSAAGDLESARRVLDEMTSAGVRLNVVTYNIALNSRARAGDARGAVNLLAEMEAGGIAPSVISFATAINAAAHFNSSALAATLLAAMAPAGVAPNAYVFTAALAACENDPDDSAAAAAAQLVMNDMAAGAGSFGADMNQELVQRAASQARRLLARDPSARNMLQTREDELLLGIKLTGRQSAV